MNEQNITLSLNLVNGVLQYLSSRPYAEVFQLVAEMQRQAAPQLQQEPEPAVSAD